jgi:hypothetical protein
MKNLLLPILYLYILFLSGCATNPETKKEADAILNSCSVCSDMFNDPMYQWDSKRSVRGFLVMAFGRDEKGACACATANLREVETGLFINDVEQADINNLAIARCNEQLRSVSKKGTCEIFAINEEIVWKKNPETGEDGIGLQ